MPTTLLPVRTSTPSFTSCSRARADSLGTNVPSTRSEPSSSTTRARRESMRRNSSASVCCAISVMVPAISTPVGPPPMITNVIHASRSASSRLRSARSKAPMTRARMVNASASVFRPGACTAQSSWPK